MALRNAMSPAEYGDAIIRSVDELDGFGLAALFTLPLLGASSHAITPTADVLTHLRDARPYKIQMALRKCSGYLKAPWEELATNHLVAAHRLSLVDPDLLRRDGRAKDKPALPSLRGFGSDAIVDNEGRTTKEVLQEAWEGINAVVVALLRFFSSQSPGRWCLPLVTTVLSSYRKLAVIADRVISKHASSTSSASSSSTASPQPHLEECARQLNKAFSVCVADRATEMEGSRKWGTYEIVGMVFRGYFKLKSLPLCRNILRALTAADLPPLEAFPRAQQVTFHYYVGVLAFLNEEYAKAETELSIAFNACHAPQRRNQALILKYLIPCRLLRGSLPSQRLLRPFPSLSALYLPFVRSFRRGDVRSYDEALSEPRTERALVEAGTYLAMERGREGCLRGLFRRVYQAKEKQTRISIDTFHRALRFVGVDVEPEETEWFVAQQIAKGYMRGYISHERQMTVLSAQNAFPSLHTVTVS